MQSVSPQIADPVFQELLGSYQDLLCSYLTNPDETIRQQAGQFGRSLIAREIEPDVLLAIHHRALRHCAPREADRGTRMATDLLIEALYAYSKTYRSLARERQADVQRLERYAQALEAFNQDMVRLNQDLQEQHAEMKKSQGELEKVANQKSELLSTVSHEIRTPLTALLGFGEFLEEGLYGELTPPQLEVLDRMVQGGRDLLELINNLLDMSKLEANRIELHCEPVRLSSLIENALDKVMPLAQRKGVSLSAQPLPEDLPLVHVDPMRIIQVLVNLLGNAVKFTEPGGSVEVGARPEGAEVRVFVKDTGIGIPPEAQKRLFERFTQAESVKQYGGTGLGLAISRELIALHHGRIWVESLPQQGATFTFTIPAWQDSVLSSP